MLDAIVAADRGPAGFAGTLCFGVADEKGGSFWRVSFGRKVEARFELFPTGEAWVVISKEEADRVVFGSGTPAPIQIMGNKKLLARFIGRYLAAKNVVSVRSA
jgi:hypothetical protein